MQSSAVAGSRVALELPTFLGGDQSAGGFKVKSAHVSCQAKTFLKRGWREEI